jgi:hypothetical protein
VFDVDIPPRDKNGDVIRVCSGASEQVPLGYKSPGPPKMYQCIETDALGSYLNEGASPIDGDLTTVMSPR